MRVILFQPQIPQNTGNIIRTCSAMNCTLILVRPLGFSLSARQMKRAGLDYFQDVIMTEVDDLEPLLDEAPFYFFSSHSDKTFTEGDYPQDIQLIFGNEKAGLPSSFFQNYPDRFLTIPMKRGARCLNLSNAVAIGITEARRQQGFIFSSEKSEIKSL